MEANSKSTCGSRLQTELVCGLTQHEVSKKMRHYISVLLVGCAFFASCGSIKQYETPQQPLQSTLRTHIGGTIFKLEKAESLPNAFGGADIYGGRRPTGSVELKYLGVAEGGRIKLRVLTTDVTTNENWRRRLGREGYATSSSDAIDFEHDPSQPFEMEGYVIHFIDTKSSSISYRVVQGSPASSSDG